MQVQLSSALLSCDARDATSSDRHLNGADMHDNEHGDTASAP